MLARLRFSLLLCVLLTLVACSERRSSETDVGAPLDAGARLDAGSPHDAGAPHDAGGPLDISAIDCARTSLGQGWKLPVLPTLLGCRTHAECTRLPHGRCVGYPHMRCDYAAGPGAFHELCASDADCVNGVGGYCTEALEATQCVYDECSTDADCGRNRVCLCSDGGGRHYCVTDGCHSDADCGAGQHCKQDGSLGGVFPQLHCTTANDACREHADCPPGDDDFCGYDLDKHHWVCRPYTIVD